MVYFQALFSVPLVYTSVFLPVPCCFDDCGCEIRKCKTSNLFFFFKIVLTVYGPLRFHMNFRMGFSISVKKVVGISVGMALNLQIAWDGINILTILSPNP